MSDFILVLVTVAKYIRHIACHRLRSPSHAVYRNCKIDNMGIGYICKNSYWSSPNTLGEKRTYYVYVNFVVYLRC